MPKRDRAEYMRSYRVRKRREAQSATTRTPSEAAAPFDLPDLAAIAEPPDDEPDAITLPVRLSDAQLATLGALMRAVRARYGSRVMAPDAMRVALDLAHRAIAGSD